MTERLLMLARLQGRLGLPLPSGATADDQRRALELLRSARDCLPDLAGVERFRRWAMRLHRKYADRPAD
jgi:hypothetical protein